MHYLHSLEQLAKVLDVSEYTLMKLTREVEEHYHRFKVRKRGGGHRILTVPSPQLKLVQRRILKRLLLPLPLSDACMGFRQGRSTKSNAERHVGKRFVFNTDLKDFFPSLGPENVFYLFVTEGVSDKVAFILSRLTTLHDELPQGAPTSPALANLLATQLDHRMMAYCLSQSMTYTRYCDDITISGDNRFTLASTIRVREIIESEGFTINERKTRLLCRNSSQVVTGIVVNEKTNLPRKLRHNLRAMIHNAEKDPALFQKNRKLLEGYLAYLYMVDPESKAVSKFKTKLKDLASLTAAAAN